MAESASAANQPCHTRSISLPSRSHSAALRVEEELHKLRSSMASPSSTPEKMCDGLRRLEGVYESVNQQILIHPLQRRWAEEETDGCIRLLDVCSAVKDRLTADKAAKVKQVVGCLQGVDQEEGSLDCICCKDVDGERARAGAKSTAEVGSQHRGV
ncbi:unnamed protein product [Musa acuminata subsp. malaccensis]|uniref:(wild Malaysian banana) hypothetical protein n=1 Tax=Musa acuminata subsp. malaccensis TaxID=214687 RepID=A0A804ICC6_MUSAM|nr:unnamed protein product [Musa acuminata subsp. malaccensis]